MRRSTASARASVPDGTRELQPVTAAPHVDAETLLDVAQVLLHRAREVGEPVVVGFRERDLALFRRIVQATLRAGSREPAAQRIRHRLGDLDVDVAVDQRGRPVEVDPAVVAGAARELAGVAARRALDQHALYGADHRSRVARGLLADQRLQPLEPPLLFIVRHVVRAARPRAFRDGGCR